MSEKDNRRDGRFLPQMPEYSSPFFGYELIEAERARGIIVEAEKQVFLAQRNGSKDTCMIALGSKSDGIIGTPTLFIPSNSIIKREGGYSRTKIGIPILLPMSRFSEQNSSRRRKLEGQFKKHIDKDIRVYERYGYDVDIERGNNKRVDTLVDIPTEGANPWIYYYPEFDFTGQPDSMYQEFFEAAIRNALTIAFIYCTELLDSNRISLPFSKLSIDPNRFKIDYRSEQKTDSGPRKITAWDILAYGSGMTGEELKASLQKPGSSRNQNGEIASLEETLRDQIGDILEGFGDEDEK